MKIEHIALYVNDPEETRIFSEIMEERHAI